MNGGITNPPVTFSYTTWVAMFPEFGALSAEQGQAYFNLACLICGNTCSNPINADGNLATLLYVLTSHEAWLRCPKDNNGNPAATGTPASPLVGRISSAQQGSVNVQLEWPLDGNSVAQEKYLAQTPYGAKYWADTAQYRTSRYAARPTRVVNGYFPGSGFGWGW